MRFGYTILYVRDVADSLGFYERAFRQSRRFLHESGQYGELETAGVTLAFASHELAAENVPGAGAPDSEGASSFEVCFVSEDVPTAFAAAVSAGAEAVSEPHKKSWGQQVAYVRDPDGVLVEIASPVSA